MRISGEVFEQNAVWRRWPENLKTQRAQRTAAEGAEKRVEREAVKKP
jgi:hypothetical protein